MRAGCFFDEIGSLWGAWLQWMPLFVFGGQLGLCVAMAVIIMMMEAALCLHNKIIIDATQLSTGGIFFWLLAFSRQWRPRLKWGGFIVVVTIWMKASNCAFISFIHVMCSSWQFPGLARFPFFRLLTLARSGGRG